MQPEKEYSMMEEPPDPERLFAFYQAVVSREFRPLGDAEFRDCAIVGSDPRFQHLCVYDGDVIIGWAYLKPIEPGFLDLGIAVHPDYRGQGVGERMLSRLLEIADKPIKLSALATNRKAIAWYKRHGFSVLHHYNTLTEECVRMVRDA